MNNLQQSIEEINKQFDTELMLGLEGKDAVISLLDVARITGRLHDNLLKSVRKHLESEAVTGGVNFYGTSYTTAQGKELQTYLLDRKAFYFFVLGMTGSKVASIRLKYINAFEAMRELLYAASNDELDHARAVMKGYRLQLAEAEDRAEVAEQMSSELRKTIVEIEGSSRPTHVFKQLNQIPQYNKLLNQREFMLLLRHLRFKSNKQRTAMQCGIDLGYMTNLSDVKNGRTYYSAAITSKGKEYLVDNYMVAVESFKQSELYSKYKGLKAA
ncbi:Rha family transcriptional regulator [Vibrio tubiashii]|uniref:Rha family transcriptional regulator n=1 Tax=Vibrio tubiashii TaxID=29498 RepID=UPI00234F8E6C|nr:Rha family transcriptional regulator [Vibrio tubiashii]WCP68129.1 Rha family transcriptional regulator [Vibrio tubiashii]